MLKELSAAERATLKSLVARIKEHGAVIALHITHEDVINNIQTGYEYVENEVVYLLCELTHPLEKVARKVVVLGDATHDDDTIWEIATIDNNLDDCSDGYTAIRRRVPCVFED